MTTDEVKRTLSGIPPQHDFARAINAVLAGMQIEEVQALTAPPGVNNNEQAREHHCGRLAALRDAKDRLGTLWAKSLAKPEADGITGN